MWDARIKQLIDAYPAIYLACHRRHVRDDSSGRSLTENQASILSHLHLNEPTTLSKLAEHMGVGRSAMSIAVSKLSRRRFIRRAKSDRDARQINLFLTPQGQRLREQNAFLDPKLIKDMLRIVGVADVDPALAGLTALANAANVLLKRRSRMRNR